jgi:RNA polymerase sigma-70 factor, ECF subfamily
MGERAPKDEVPVSPARLESAIFMEGRPMATPLRLLSGRQTDATTPSAPSAAVEPDLWALITECVRGDSRSCERLFVTYRAQVHRHVSFLLRSRADAEDVVQEIFVELFRSLRNFEGRASFSTWLHRITVRVTYRQLRRLTPAAPPPELVYDAAQSSANAGTGQQLEQHERHERTMRLLDRLSPKKRVTLLLHDLQGIEAKEIARMTGAPLLTVRTRLFYARREFEALARRDPALAEFFATEDEDEEGGP